MNSRYWKAVVASLCAVVLGWPALARAEGGKIPDSGKARQLRKSDKVTGRSIVLELAGSFQGLGAIVRSRLGYKWRLYAHKNLALENNFVLLNGILQATPAFVNAGAGLTLQPLSIFNLSASYMYRLHFPTFTSATVFKDKAALNERYKGVDGFIDGEQRLDRQLEQVIKANGGQRPFVTGHLIAVSATFQIKLLNIIFAANAGLVWNIFDFEDADASQLLYEPFSDIVVNKSDMVFNLTLIGGYEWRNLLLLVVYSHSTAFGSESQRALVGPGVRWEITKKAGALNKPYLLFFVRWYLLHRWRVSPVPNIAFILGTHF